MRRTLTIVCIALFVAMSAMFVLTREQARPPGSPAAGEPAQIQRGEYLAGIGGCYACHTARGGAPYAGGLEMATPFGTLYTTNITPDPETGIGAWSSEDFWRALHDGRNRAGSFLYPAMPYTNYTRLTRGDSDAMYAYFRSLRPVRQANRPHDLAFPYSRRELMVGWRTLYFSAGEHRDDPLQSKEWNRGAYLVEGLGHCSACHGTRNALGAVKDGSDVSGGLIPVQNWYAPSLVSGSETGIGQWEVAEIVELLRTGVAPQGAVYGPMATVVRHNLQNALPADLAAMAIYLQSRARSAVRAPVPAAAPVDAQVAAQKALGARLYERHCADCHRPDGSGVSRIYPPLAGNPSLLTPNPVNPIRMVLNGGFPPSTAGNPRPYGMPPFYHQLTDAEVAAVVTWLRGAWGNSAAPVSATEVERARGVPAG